MTTELWITIGIALIGWTWAIVQVLYKRRWQKKDMIAARRYDAYSQYIRKCEEISENMRKDPQAIFDIVQDSFTRILKGDKDERDNALIELNKQLLDYVRRSASSLSIVNQESTPLLLIASKELSEKIKEQKNLTADFSNELQNGLNKVNINDGNSFQVLNTIGQDKRWKRFSSLNTEILTLMRKEIDIK